MSPLKKWMEANNSTVCFWQKIFNKTTQNRGDEGGCRLGLSTWLQNWLPDHSVVSLFSSFLFLSPTGKAYAPEFYYDTYNPLWQNRPRVYSYSLQWTQMNPDAVDRILAYRLGIRQVSKDICLCRTCLLILLTSVRTDGPLFYFIF